MQEKPVLVQAACDYDFMRCLKCGRIATKPEMEAALGVGGSGRACPCSGQRYQPVDLPWWGWCLPRVWSFAVKRLRGLI